MKLAELQAYFARAVTTGSGPIAGLDDVFVSRGALSASERLAIYNRGYFYRLLDALGSVFEHTRRALGETEFERLGLAYLSLHPSEHPAVERVGRAFPEFLRTTEPLLADLAALEWARLCALVAPNSARVASAREAAHPDFAQGMLQFSPSLQVLELDPGALRLFAGEPAAPGSGRCGVAVWRPDHIVRHEPLTTVELEALRAARDGAPMNEVCARFDRGSPSNDASIAAGVIGRWFSRAWVESLTFPGP